MAVLSINKLDYKNLFQNFNLEIEKKNFVTILGSNGSGKTILTKIISGIIPTEDICILDNISLNKHTVLTYMTKLGIVTNEFNQEFLFKKVKDELAYPLLNLGYPEHKINKKIKYASDFFQIEDLLNKSVSTLTLSKRKMLLIIIAIIHEPSLLILDDAFQEMDLSDKEFILEKLSILKKRGLTILNFTSNLETISVSDKLYMLDNFKLKEIDSNIDDLRLNVPFVLELSSKLKDKGVIDKLYFNIEELVGDLWK